MSLLSLAGLSKSYGFVTALRDPSLVVEAGEVHALMGENGAGKSTLIKIPAGVVHADRGAIRLEGRSVSIGSAREAHRLGLRFLHQELRPACSQALPGVAIGFAETQERFQQAAN
jgi:ABC-type sugar transport system ATPase subunit